MTKDSAEKKAAPKTGGKSAGLRTARRKAYYAAQPARTATNKKRRMRKHLRSNPRDEQNHDAFEKRLAFGATGPLGLTKRGKRLLKRKAA